MAQARGSRSPYRTELPNFSWFVSLVQFHTCNRGSPLFIDLHCHTTCSDGTLAPVQLLNAAVAAGVGMLAVTDHDTVQAYGCIRDEAEARGVELFCGVEISTHLPGCSRSVHLLGYFPSQPDASFFRWLEDLQLSRRGRNAALLARLQELGLDIQWEDVSALAQTQVGRPHFAAVLLQKGYVSSLKEAFNEYLGEDARAWVGRDEPHLAEALERILASGGLSSLAHPVRIARDAAEVARVVAEYAARGLDAVECFHSEHSAEDTAALLALAEKHNLLVTGGSDFHGATKPGVALVTGRGTTPLVPPDVAEPLRRAVRVARDSRRRSPAG